MMQFLVKEIRIQAGRNAEPSYALIDSQSVKTAYRSDKKGYDGGKNKRNKASYCNGYYGKYTLCSCSCSKYS